MKNLDTILKGFKKSRDQLLDYVQKTDAAIEKNSAKMNELESENIRNRRDRERANKAATQITKLIGEDE